jgi:hypothetical protein
VHINLGVSPELSEYQIEITAGYCVEALGISLPNVIPLAGIANDSKAEMKMPRAISFNFTSLGYFTRFIYISCE